MKKRNREQLLLNSILLILILITCFQTVILAKGRIFFVKETEYIDEYSSEYAKKFSEYIQPYKTLIKSSPQNLFLIAPGDMYYLYAWKNTLSYLEGIRSMDPIVYKEEKWDEIIKKTGILFDFKDGIELSLFNLVYGINTSILNEKGIYLIYDIYICPIKNNTDAKINFYINTGKNVYGYEFKQENAAKDYEDIFNMLNIGSSYLSKKFSFFSERVENLEGQHEIIPDALIVYEQENSMEFSRISFSVPYVFDLQGQTREQHAEYIKDKLLGSLSDRYQSSTGNDNTHYFYYFTNTGNTYRILEDGFIEYKSLYDVINNEKGKLENAYLKAAEFISSMTDVIDKREDINTGLSIVLTGIDILKDGYYEFNFDYVINGWPVVPDSKSTLSDGELLTHGFIVRANEKRVIFARGFIKQMKITDLKRKYQTDFISVIEKIINKNDDFIINDICIGYKYGYDVNDYEADPCWIFTGQDNVSVFETLDRDFGE